ncbi:MAG: nuclear transport factor 2 family protein [Burkholderiales bacterium]|nr:nuclear transport factor 2 family protein [Burkholderiales bacterium]
MSALEDRLAAADLLYREAHFLDTARWDDWLALYCEDAVFRVPAWRADGTPTADPGSEVALIHHAARAGLEDRVWRLRSGLSAASGPLPRVSHGITGVIVAGRHGATLEVHAQWTCHVYELRQRTQHVFFGRYEMLLRPGPAGLAIAAKTVILMNDRIPSFIDFYCV